MNETRLIQGQNFTLSLIKNINDYFEYQFLNSQNDLIRISFAGDNVEFAWEKLDFELTKIKKDKLLNFVFYHGPVSGNLSMLETELLAQGVMVRLDGIKTPPRRSANDYNADDQDLAQMLANAYNQGVRDTQKLNK